jgi:exodeoxyribonuclease III
MRIITANLNGVRSAQTKGFFDWLQTQELQALGVQELKAQDPDMGPEMKTVYNQAGKPLLGHFHHAEKKGYSGVGLYTQAKPSEILVGLGHPAFDAEGRWIEKRFDKGQTRVSLISAYFPSGSSGEERQAAKFAFLEVAYPRLLALSQEREFILMGDLNIAHHPIDLKNWKGNLKNSGFLPEERAWLTQLIETTGLVDVYRHLYPEAGEEAYTWWSQRGQAYAKNVGWRIDYQLATPGLARTAQRAHVFKDLRFSDHAPLVVDYDFKL